MPEAATINLPSTVSACALKRRCRVAVIWIDWYAYHVARFRGLEFAPGLTGQVSGIELVGGVGVHSGLNFRNGLTGELNVETLMPSSSWRQSGQVRLALKLWRHLATLKPEILLVPGYYTLPAIAAAVWARMHGATTVLMTESTAEDHHRTLLNEYAKSILIRALFDWAVAGGKAHRRYLRMLRFPASRTASFYDVVDNDFFARSARALRMRSSSELDLPPTYFLYVGRLAPEKNLEALLRCWITYRTHGGTWPLVLVGDGPSAPLLRSLVDSSELASHVIFAGHQVSAALPRFYAFAGCFILPSTQEPWGLVVNEAMASGLPVLVSSHCGCASDLVVSGCNGFVFDPNSSDGPTSLTHHLHVMESASPDRLRAMAACSERLIQGYTPAHFGAEIARIAEDPLGTGRVPVRLTGRADD